MQKPTIHGRIQSRGQVRQRAITHHQNQLRLQQQQQQNRQQRQQQHQQQQLRQVRKAQAIRRPRQNNDNKNGNANTNPIVIGLQSNKNSGNRNRRPNKNRNRGPNRAARRPQRQQLPRQPKAINSNSNRNPNRLPSPPPRPADQCQLSTGFSFHKFQREDAIKSYFNCMSFRHKDKAQYIKIGKSSEGKDLFLVKVSVPSPRGISRKPAVWIDGGVHAREWISPAAVAYIAYELLEKAGAHLDILNEYDFYLMPLVNPDGYEYSHTNDRFWRKTRSKNSGVSCMGTDPNRNWGHQWGGVGASKNPCDETYRGSNEFSEAETTAVKNYLTAESRRQNFKLFVTYHSYGQYILYPWGYDKSKNAPNWRAMHAMAEVAGRAMQDNSGHKYTIGSAAKVLYPAAGGSDDWAKGALGIPYTYTIELPDTGRHGFLLPASRIEAVGREAFSGIQAMVGELVRQSGGN